MYNMDSSLVDAETLQQLSKIQPDPSEVEMIVAYLNSSEELDRPDLSVMMELCA